MSDSMGDGSGPDRFRYDWSARALLVLGLCYLVVGLASGVQAYFVAGVTAGEWRVTTIVTRRVVNALLWLPLTPLVAELTWWSRGRLTPISRALVLGSVGGVVVLLVNVAQAVAGSLLVSPVEISAPSVAASGLALRELGPFGFIWYVLLVFAAVAAEAAWGPPVPSGAPYRSNLEVKERRTTHLVPTEVIDWIEAAGDYALIHTADRDYLLQERMKVLESVLDPGIFARVHRSAIVNLRSVQGYDAGRHGDLELRLRGGATVRLTRSRRASVIPRLEAATM